MQIKSTQENISLNKLLATKWIFALNFSKKTKTVLGART